MLYSFQVARFIQTGYTMSALDYHDSTHTAYAVYRSLVGIGIVWYDYETTKWGAYPHYTTDVHKAKRVCSLYTYAAIVAVDVTVSNARYI